MKSSPTIALSLFHLSSEMTGPVAYSPLRAAFRKRVLKVWPEAETGFDAASPLHKEEREIEVSPEEQTALGEGLWEIYTRPVSSDKMREACEALAKVIGVSKKFAERVSKLEPIKELMQADEAITGDAGG